MPGFHPGIENSRKASTRAAQAADILIAQGRAGGRRRAGGAWLFQLDDRPRSLRRRGFSRTGSHRARYWNTVIYEKTKR